MEKTDKIKELTEVKNVIKLLPEQKAYVKAVLIKFDFVRWDRYIHQPKADHFQVYGWIKRKDKNRDFISLIFTITTNSITYSGGSNSTSEYHSKIEDMTGQPLVKCHRVEEIVKIKNMIKLKK